MGRSKILVVDSNKDALEAYLALLSILGSQGEAARTGTEAILQASAAGWGLAMISLTVPDMEAWEMAREFKSRHGASVELVAIADFYTQSVIDQALASSF